MGASDYMVGNAPGAMSYGAGNMAQQLYQMIGGLPQDYQQGQQAFRQNRQQDLFKDGIPQDRNGQPDYAAMISKMIQTGGAPVAQQMIPAMIGQQTNAQIANVLNPGQSPAQPPAQNNSPTGQTPAMLQRGGGAAAGQSQSGGDNGRNTITSMVTQNADDPDAAGATIAKVAQYTGLDPNAHITNPRDVTRVQNAMKAAGLRVQNANGVPAGRPVPNASSPEESNDTTPVGTGGPSQAAPGGGGQVSPSPQGDSFNTRFNAANMRQTPVGTEAEARKAIALGQRQQAAAAMYGASPKAAEAALAAGKANIERGEKILESLGKYNEPTTKQKNVESGAEGHAAQAAADIKYYDSLHRGLAGSGMIAAQQKQNVDMLRQVAESPSFTPGTGTDAWLTYQRALTQFGINPTGAAPREIFNQVSARILADQFSGLKSMAAETGEQGARIFKSMLDIEEKANITPEDSLAGIKAKLNLLDKTGDLMMKWADKADDYKIKHGRLDAGFNKELRADIAKARVPNAVPKGEPKGTGVTGAPPIGHIEQGMRFKGGNHRDQNNWEPVRAAGERS